MVVGSLIHGYALHLQRNSFNLSKINVIRSIQALAHLIFNNNIAHYFGWFGIISIGANHLWCKPLIRYKLETTQNTKLLIHQLPILNKYHVNSTSSKLTSIATASPNLLFKTSPSWLNMIKIKDPNTNSWLYILEAVKVTCRPKLDCVQGFKYNYINLKTCQDAECHLR